MNTIDMDKIQGSFTKEWKTAKDIKKELNLNISTQKLGKILAKITSKDKRIDNRMEGHVLAYRLKEDVLEENTLLPETKMETIDIEKKLSNLISELKEEGLDVQSICYNALQESKIRYKKEIGFVKENASMFYGEFLHMKDVIRGLKNQIEDYKDMIRQTENKSLAKAMNEERSQRSDLLA